MQPKLKWPWSREKYVRVPGLWIRMEQSADANLQLQPRKHGIRAMEHTHSPCIPPPPLPPPQHHDRWHWTYVSLHYSIKYLLKYIFTYCLLYIKKKFFHSGTLSPPSFNTAFFGCFFCLVRQSTWGPSCTASEKFKSGKICGVWCPHIKALHLRT